VRELGSTGAVEPCESPSLACGKARKRNEFLVPVHFINALGAKLWADHEFECILKATKRPTRQRGETAAKLV